MVLENKILPEIPMVADTAEKIRDGKCVAGVLGTTIFICFSGEKSGGNRSRLTEMGKSAGACVIKDCVWFRGE